MLTRIYIDNFRCFVNFEYRPEKKQLIVGPNGAGKSSLLDALLFLRRLVVLGQNLERRKILAERTLWMDLPNQTFELEASLDRDKYLYRLVIDSYGDPKRARVALERVACNGKTIFQFNAGEVHLFDDQFNETVAYPFDRHRSALALTEMQGNKRLTRFKLWFSNIVCFRTNPFRMRANSESEDLNPYFDLSNFSAWYRHLVQSFPQENAKLLESLRTVFDDFSFLKLERMGEDSRELVAEFVHGNSPPTKLGFGKLSDGQRCLIGLYTILHFVLAQGNTVILDEPDNFISLRELQPWLLAASDMVDENRGQVMIISHHPEFMNQWAPDYGVRFKRDGMGPVQIKPFRGGDYASLLPSEIIARGWENE
jgi:ATPase subunit of ABC transporter with duplicated ATPase domains